MDRALVEATFTMLGEHKETGALIGQPVFQASDVVEYLFDGYMPCLLIEEDGQIIDVQDFSMEMLDEGEDYITGRARYDSIEQWAEAFIKSITMEPI